MCLRWAVFYVLAFVQPPIPRCVDLTDPQVAFLEHYSERRPAPSPRTDHSFAPLAAAGVPDLCPTSARVADQTVEWDWRQAPPRAEPALSLAPLCATATPTPKKRPSQSEGLDHVACAAVAAHQPRLPAVERRNFTGRSKIIAQLLP